MLLVYEPAFGGHHLVYLRYILAGASERDLPVRLITSAQQIDSPHYEERLGALDVPVDVVMEATPAAGVVGLRSHVSAIRQAVRRHGPSDVLIPYLDGLLYALPALPRRARYHGILFSPAPFTHPRKRVLAHLSLGLRRVAALHHLDDSLVAQVGHPKLHWLADPVPGNPPEPAAKQRLGLAADRRVVLVAGVLTRRKGVSQLLAAARRPDWPQDLDLLFVGRPDGEVAGLLSNAPEHVLLRDDHVDDATFARWFRAADVVAATYPTYLGSSGIVLNAAAAGTPLVALQQGWIGRAVAENGLGVAVSDLSASSLLRGVQSALELAANPAWMPDPEFVRVHSVPAFQEQLFRYIAC